MSKRIKGITIEIDGETKGLDKALSDVNKRSRDVNKELRDVERLLKFNPGNTELVAQKQKLLGDQVQATKEKLDRLKGSQEQVNEAFKRGDISEEQYRAFQREIAETESKLQHYEGQLKSTQDRMKQFGEAVGETGEKFKAAGDKMTSAGKSLSTKVTAPLAGIGALATKVGSDFEASMSKVAAVSGATGGDLEALTEKAREMGATTQFSASEAADALNYMALAGWDTNQMLDGISGVMDLAAASGEDLGQVSDILTDGLSAFGMQAGESARFADVLAAASANANTDVSGLGGAFQYVAPVAGALGFTIEDTAQAIGIMSNAGIKGQKAGTALRTMMTNLAKPTAAMEKQMDKLGISLTDSEGNMKDFDDIMKDLRVSFADLTEAEQASAAATIFGKEAMSGALAIVNAAESDFNSLGEAINNSEGAANEMATTMQDNLQGRMKEMKSAMEEAAISIYDNLKPALEFIVQLIKDLADWFNNLSPAMQNTIIVIAGLAAAIGPLLIVLGVVASSIGSLMTLFSSLIAFLPKLGVAFTAITGPVGIVIGIIAALIAIGVLLWKNWDTIKAKTIEIWGTVSKFLDDTWKSIKKAIETVWNSIADFFTKTWDKITTLFNSVLDNISKVIQRYWDSIKDGVEKVWNGIKSYFEGVWELIKNIFVGAFLVLMQLITGQWGEAKKSTEQIWENIKQALSKVWEGIKGVFSGALSAVLGFVKTYFTDVKNSISAIWEGIKSFLSTTVENIKTTISNGFQSMKQSVSDTMSEAWDTIKSIWNDILSFLKGIDLFQIGRDIISGLIKGISNMASSAVKAVKGVVDGAINGAKNLLGIKSPSRVFMDIGKDTGEGLEIGLRSMGNRVKKAGQAVADASIPNIPPYGQGTNGFSNNSTNPPITNDNREINITLDASNMDEVRQVMEFFTGLKQTQRQM